MRVFLYFDKVRESVFLRTCIPGNKDFTSTGNNTVTKQSTEKLSTYQNPRVRIAVTLCSLLSKVQLGIL